MFKKTVSEIILTLLIMATLTLTLEIQQAKADGLTYIYITPEGDINGTDKIQRDGDIYTFNSTISGKGIIIQRDGVTLDGANYTLQGKPAKIGVGVNLTDRSHVMIKNVEIREFQYGILLNGSKYCQLYHNQIFDGDTDDSDGKGIYLWNSTHNTLFHNTVDQDGNDAYRHGIVLTCSSYNRLFNCTAKLNGCNDEGFGIRLIDSSCNDAFDNTVRNNHDGIGLSHSNNNSILYNTVNDNGQYPPFQTGGEGIGLEHNSSYNTIRYNNFYGNLVNSKTDDSLLYNNSWDDGCKGNHWSDYNGTPPYYEIDGNNYDYHPQVNKYNYTYVHLTTEAGLGGTTDLIPETYPIVEGMNVTVTAIPTEENYSFTYWTLDGSTYIYDNPAVVTMDSDHTLKAWFSVGSGGTPEPCPTLFAWNGTEYVDLGVIGIHAEEDVVNETLMDKKYVAVKNYKAKFRLQEGWPGLHYSHSEIDQVKLYAIVDGERRLCPLLKAIHSEQGNVYLQLLLSDDYKSDIYLLETIKLKFIIPYQTDRIQGYVFVIEGRNQLKL